MSTSQAQELQRLLRGAPARDSWGYDLLVEVDGGQRVGEQAFADALRAAGVHTVRSVHGLPGELGDPGSDPLWDSALATTGPGGAGASWRAHPGPRRPGGDGRPYDAVLWRAGPPLPLPPVDDGALAAAVADLDEALLALHALLAGRQAGRVVREALLGLALHQDAAPAPGAWLGVVEGGLRQVLLHGPAELLGAPPTLRRPPHGTPVAGPGEPLERVHRAALPVLRLASAHVKHVAAGGELPPLHGPSPPLRPLPPLPPGAPAPLAPEADPALRALALALDAALAAALHRLSEPPHPRERLPGPPSVLRRLRDLAGPRPRRPLPTTPGRDAEDLRGATTALRDRLEQARDVLSGAQPAPWWDVPDPAEPEGGSTGSRLHAAAQLVMDIACGASRGPQPHLVALADPAALVAEAWRPLLAAAAAVEPATRPLQRTDSRLSPPRTPTAWWHRP